MLARGLRAPGRTEKAIVVLGGDRKGDFRLDGVERGAFSSL
jgi:hypothetical protein